MKKCEGDSDLIDALVQWTSPCLTVDCWCYLAALERNIPIFWMLLDSHLNMMFTVDAFETFSTINLHNVVGIVSMQ